MIRIRFLRIADPAAAVLLLAVLGGGCATTPDTGPAPQDRFPPPDFSPARVGPMLAHLKTTVRSEAGKRTFRQVVATEPPDRIRVEIFGPFGRPRLVLAVRDGVAVGILPADRAYFLEPDSSTVFRALLGADIDARDLVPILTGDVLFRTDQTRVGPVRPGSGGWMMQARQEDTGMQYDLVLDPRSHRIATVGLTPAGASDLPALKIRYRRWRVRNGRSLPTRIEVEVPAAGISISTILQKESAEPAAFSDRLFQPSVPAGFRRIEVRTLATDAPWLAPQD